MMPQKLMEDVKTGVRNFRTKMADGDFLKNPFERRPGAVADETGEHSEEQSGGFGRRWNACRAFMKRPSTYPFFLLSFINLWLHADQNLISPNLSQIAREFNLTDIEKDVIIGGQVNLAFILVGLFTSIFVGYFADRARRRDLFTAVVMVGEFSCFCTIFVTSLPGFFAARALTGISIGGSGPLLFSMTGDLFPPEERGKALAFLNVLRIFGVIAGQTIASSLGPSMGFRLPFAIVAIPPLILAPLYRLTTKEPTKGSKEHAVMEAAGGNEVEDNFYQEKITWAKLKVALQSGTVWLQFLQAVPGSLPFSVLFAFFPDFLVTDIGGIQVEETAAVVFSFGIANVIGLIVGGFICDRLWKYKYEFLPLYSGITTWIGALPMFLLINAPAQPLGFYAGILFPVGLVLSQAIVGLSVTFLNVTVPETRGSLAAINTIFNDLGSGIGALSVSALVAATGSRRSAFSIAICFWFLSGGFMMLMACFVRKDYERSQAILRAAVDNANANGRDNPTGSPQEFGDVEGSGLKKSANKAKKLSDETSTSSEDGATSTPYNTSRAFSNKEDEAMMVSSINPMFRG